MIPIPIEKGQVLTSGQIIPVYNLQHPMASETEAEIMSLNYTTMTVEVKLLDEMLKFYPEHLWRMKP